MEVVLKGRGIRITDQMRRVAEHKLGKLERLAPRVRRLEVEIIGEHNPRIDGSHRVEVSADASRKVFRAEGAGKDVETALDQVVERLEKQISSYQGKLRNRRQAAPIVYNPPD
jgi:ribosomal subunit interface protein